MPWIRRWFSRRVEVRERSMEPALRPGDRLRVDRWAYRRASPRAGEIVLLLDPEGSGRWLLKRVADPAGPIPAATCWVLGDAAELSRDSRQFGPVPLPLLRGRAYRRYAPPDRAGPIGEAPDRRA